MTEFLQLLANEIPNIIVDEFLSPKQTAALIKAITAQPEWCEMQNIKEHDHLFGDVNKPKQMFSSQYMIASHGKSEDEYVAICAEYKKVWQRVVESCQFDPFDLLVNYLNHTYDVHVKIAQKNGFTYCPLVARDLRTQVLAHADFGLFDGPAWEIAKVTQQLAWNIYLTDPGEGGQTTVYDKVWDCKDVIDENSYGIQEFKQPVKTVFAAKPGRLVIFNNQNFHSIQASTQSRIAIGGMFGKTAAGNLIAWS
jgi:hypothetical protein